MLQHPHWSHLMFVHCICSFIRVCWFIRSFFSFALYYDCVWLMCFVVFMSYLFQYHRIWHHQCGEKKISIIKRWMQKSTPPMYSCCRWLTIFHILSHRFYLQANGKTQNCIKIVITNGIDSNDKKRGTETLEKNYRQKNSTGVHMHLIVLGIKCRWKWGKLKGKSTKKLERVNSSHLSTLTSRFP